MNNKFKKQPGKVFNLDSVREWDDVCAEDPEAERVGSQMLLGIKHEELPED